ncbi:phosphotransferase [Paenibacillus albus]|uniref:Aminoglycoside phosphotransferase family protein n=1 Tax=Paenibacillus albus TaxID=2495582 RepID=A0A3Q8X215_9BACL|nr:phosphotransferase [Paenibacillus albus]AZN38346.1 aminoglycoside phosphotransferase family protein [Paenibacillus albus]
MNDSTENTAPSQNDVQPENSAQPEIEAQSFIYGLLRNPSTGQVLAIRQPNSEGWSLPALIITEQTDASIAYITREMSSLLGPPVIACRYVWVQLSGQSGGNEAFVELDSTDSSFGALKENEQWVDPEELLLLQPHQREIIHNYLAEATSASVPAFRQPWERTGWYAKTMSWILSSLQTLDIQLTEPPEQLKWWSLSCVLRLTTTQGTVYFKTNAKQPLFAQEPIFLTYMADVFPDRVPTILASEPAEGWMLVADAGERLSRDSAENKIQLLHTFGNMQLEMIARTNELIELGCADRQPLHLLPLVAPLLEDQVVVSEFAPEELEELRRYTPTILDMCQQISTYAVPPTLVHGDLHTGNAVICDGTITLIDWTDASVAHPFMDMFIIFDEKDLTLHTQLRDAYLELWIDFEPMPRLLALWSLCEVVHAIYHAVSYQSILQHTEVRSRGELGPPTFYLRKALLSLRSRATDSD